MKKDPLPDGSPLAELPEDLRDRVAELEHVSGGTFCFAAKDLQTGETVSYRAGRKVQTASVIKLPILVHVAMCVADGMLKWDEKLRLTNAEKVDGSGVLTYLTEGLEISLRDVCTLMTIVSDNTGTNMIIERLGTASINTRMRSLGLPITTLFRKAYTEDTPESAPYGLGVTTANEMLSLLVKLAAGELGSPELCREIILILEAQCYRDAIPRLLESEWSYAGKTGSIDAVRNDVGIVTAPDGRRFALSLFCQDLPLVLWTADNPGMVALARLAKLLIERFEA